jgi:peptide deformylase
MPQVLQLRPMYDLGLERPARPLTMRQMQSDVVGALIKDMLHTNKNILQGVGMSAVQVGARVAVSVIDIGPTPTSPRIERFQEALINPSYKGFGRKFGMWEGCLSCSVNRDTLYGRAWRYTDVLGSWYDVNGVQHHRRLSGVNAQVFQHETDHNNGVLFLQRTEDGTLMSFADYCILRFGGQVWQPWEEESPHRSADHPPETDGRLISPEAMWSYIERARERQGKVA